MKARATTAAAAEMARRGRDAPPGSRGRTALQDATHQATTPFLPVKHSRPRACRRSASCTQHGGGGSTIAAGSSAGPSERSCASGAGRLMSRLHWRHERRSRRSGADRVAIGERHAADVWHVVRRRSSRMAPVWSNNGEKLEVRYDGDVDFTDDDADVKRFAGRVAEDQGRRRC